MNVIILGDKYEKGTKSKGCAALIKFNASCNIFEQQYRCIKDYDSKANIIYVYGFDNKRFVNFIKSYNDVVTIYNQHYENFNYGYSLSLAQQYLKSNCLIFFGNTLIQQDTLTQIDNDTNSKIVISSKHKNPIGCVIDNGIVKNICFELENYIANIYYLKQQDSLLLQKLIETQKYSNYFIFELINKLIDYGITFTSLENNTRSRVNKNITKVSK